MAAKFEVYQDKAGEYRFRLKAGNGEIILSSEGYSSKSACLNGLESVKKNATDNSRYEKKESAGGKFSFILKAANHQVIGSSQSYRTASGRDNGIESVKKNAPNASVDDESSNIDRAASTLLTNDDTSTNYLFLDNFRGFRETLIPLKNVNFFVGENSTGKSSVIGLMKLLTTPSFWVGGSPIFESSEVQFGSGSFNDLVSVGEGYFAIGKHKSDPVRTGSGRIQINTYLLVFVEKDGLPAISFCAYRYKDKSYFFKMGKKIGKYKFINSDEPINFENVKDIFETWMKVYKSDNTGYKKLPEYTLPMPDMPLSYIPVVIESDLGGGLNPLLSFGSRLSRESLVWLAPIRSKPKRTYDEYKLDFSPEGQHTPYLIKKLLGKKSEALDFEKFLCDLGSKSGLFDSVAIQNYGKSLTSPFELDIVLDEKELSINNVGYGVSQALPIIVELFSRPEGTNYAVQQPEVHLHPRAQAALGEVFYTLASLESKRFFIETHSDYTIDRYRASLRRDKSKTKPPSQILFFERKNSGNCVHTILIESSGEISENQPNSYRDFFIKEELKNLGLD